MPINASVTNQQITASVGETQIDVSVSGGVGPTGTAGAAATISVGTVTTGSPGSSAAVVNAGTSSAAVLNFTIPAGATGATGPTGATGATGATGPQGPAGVVTATAPLTYNAGTQTVALSVGTGLTTSGGSLVLGTHSHAISDVTDLATTISGIDSALGGKLSATDASVTNAREWTADTVSQAEAEAGTATTRRAWTALRVWQSIAAWWATVTIGTSKIADGAVTAAKIASGQAVTFGTVTSNSFGGFSNLFVGTSTDSGNNVTTVFRVSGGGNVTVGTWQGTAVAVAYGGTGAATAADARANLGVSYGSTAGTVCQGNDARLSDARTPLSHTHSVADVTATGTPSASTFLRGDGAWASAGSTSASDLTSGTLANARLTTRQRASTNLYLWSSFR